MKILIGSSSDFHWPKPILGHAVWIESGEWFSAPLVDPQSYGPHDYGPFGIGECKCGCVMNQSSSHGPVDPFGACPENPLPTP